MFLNIEQIIKLSQTILNLFQGISMKKTKDIIVEVEDKYGDHCLGDSCFRSGSEPRRPQGHVEIYEVLEDGKKKLIEKSNLVVYKGRELVAVRLAGADYASITPTKDEFISWFGLGSGGVTVADPFTPISPTNSDSDLANEIPISAVDTTCGDYHDGAYYKHQLDSLDFEQDVYNDDRWLILKTTTTIGSGDANGYQLSEAGLFSSENTAGGYSGAFNLFARVTFAAIVKDSSRRLIFIWYIYV